MRSPQPAAPPAQPPDPTGPVPTGGPTSTRRPRSRRSSASCRAAPPGTPRQALTPAWRGPHPWAQLNQSLVPKPCCDPHFHRPSRRSSSSNWPLSAANHPPPRALLRKRGLFCPHPHGPPQTQLPRRLKREGKPGIGGAQGQTPPPGALPSGSLSQVWRLRVLRHMTTPPALTAANLSGGGWAASF